jgi:hypothetical protein
VIDWTEIPQEIGTEMTHNGVDSVTVNLGSQGGPQTWHFLQPMGAQYTDAEILPRASTPFGDSFPNSNLALEITEDGDTVYTYGHIATTFGCNLGAGSVSPDTVFYRFEPVDTYPLPMVYGASRHYHYGFSLELVPGTESRTDYYGFEIMDAYGSVVIPYDTFECLRTCSFDTIVTTLLVNGIPVMVDSTTYIVYDFFAENYGLIAHVLSYPGETNQNYTDALFLERLNFFSTGIHESKDVTVNHFSYHPNPFSDYVTITYSLSKTSLIRLKLYDSGGRLIKTIVDYIQSPGNHTITWYGINDAGAALPNGVYFLYLDVDATTCVRKMLLVR